MDYLQTTGDRLHDLELDRILARLATLEGRNTLAVTTGTLPTPIVVEAAPTVAVRTITPAGGTPMQDDLMLEVVGPVSLAQSAQTLTLTVSVTPAGTVTDIGAAGVVGTATNFAREDHMHAGVHKITGSADALGNLVFTGAGVSQVGNTFTFSGGGSGGVLPTNILVFSPGGSALSWAPPSALTEFNGLMIYRARHDLTHAAQARLALFLPLPNILPLAIPTLAAQYSTDGGTTWNYLDGATGPSVTYGAGAVISAWASLTSGAQADVLLRVVVSGGDGMTSLPFGTICLQGK